YARAVDLALDGEIAAKGCQRLAHPELLSQFPESARSVLEQFEVAGADPEVSTTHIERAGSAIHFLRDDTASSDEFRKRIREGAQVGFIRLGDPGREGAFGDARQVGRHWLFVFANS